MLMRLHVSRVFISWWTAQRQWCGFYRTECDRCPLTDCPNSISFPINRSRKWIIRRFQTYRWTQSDLHTVFRSTGSNLPGHERHLSVMFLFLSKCNRTFFRFYHGFHLCHHRFLMYNDNIWFIIFLQLITIFLIPGSRMIPALLLPPIAVGDISHLIYLFLSF